MSQNIPKFLFLDDIRVPYTVFEYTGLNFYFSNNHWHIVRNYEQFVQYIEQNGLPEFISFDHDLADSHYTPPHLWDDYEASKKWQDEQVHTEKTGYDCAMFLVEYCVQNKNKIPNWYTHSLNPVGKDKIDNLMRTARDRYNFVNQ